MQRGPAVEAEAGEFVVTVVPTLAFVLDDAGAFGPAHDGGEVARREWVEALQPFLLGPAGLAGRV